MEKEEKLKGVNMSLFEEKKQNDEILQQDRSIIADGPGRIFVMHLLFKEFCDMPDKERMQRVLQAHLGELDPLSHDKNLAVFSPLSYLAEYDEAQKIPPQILISSCSEIKNPIIDEVSKTQLWDCPNGREILDECKYHVITSDFMAAGLKIKDRAELICNFIEALAELFPSCEAFVFETSKKMIPFDSISHLSFQEDYRFLHYTVNVRLFTVEGTEDYIVDSIGMSALFLPDLQYHFRGIDANEVIKHAYHLLYYIFDYENPIQNGDLVDGIRDGTMCQEISWKARYETSLIQPIREVIDINMAEYAAGSR